jgi:hypothetical protein
MSIKIQSGISTHLHSNPVPYASSAQHATPLGEQIQTMLFGHAKPPLLNPSMFPHLAAVLRQLNTFKRKIAHLAGDHDDDYTLVLADSTLAMVDEEGRIYLGASFLQTHAHTEEGLAVMVGAIAHEIGHRPKLWGSERYQVKRFLTEAEKQAVCRHEETRADIFAGKALAECGLPAQPLCSFLEKIQKTPHPSYFPAHIRAQVILEAHESRSYRVGQRQQSFPSWDRAASAKRHLGEF